MPRVLLTPRWLMLHALAAAMVGTCAGLSWWQFERVGPGNASSLGYAFQWPAFAIFFLAVWAWLCRDAKRGSGADRAVPAPRVAGERVPDEVALPPRQAVGARGPIADGEAEDPELTAYNAMLARLHAGDHGPVDQQAGR